MKIVLIGAGSYVFGPTVLVDAIARHKIEGELALVDLNQATLESIAGVGRRMAEDLRVPCCITTHLDWRNALPVADYVILSAAPEGARRWQMDYKILLRAGIPDQDRECGGLGGLSYALRTISLALDIAEEMARVCPEALLLDVANPMPRVVTAVYRATSIRAYGFCNAAQGGARDFDWLASLVGRPASQLQVTVAGLNHFSWLISIHDRASGENLLPEVEHAVRRLPGEEGAALARWLDEYGAVAAAGAGHSSDFFPKKVRHSPVHRPYFHGNETERQARLQALRDMAAGQLDWRDHLAAKSWEHPVDFAWALSSGQPLEMPMLNLPNLGFLPDLPDGRIVEMPVIIANGKVQGQVVEKLPVQLAQLLRHVSDVHEMVALGAAQGNRALLREAILLDPAIPEKAVALQTLDDLISAHLDLLPRFH